MHSTIGKVVVVISLLGAGCGSNKPNSKPVDAPVSELEIAQDPTILISKRDKWDQLTLNGIRIGDGEASIRAKAIEDRVGDGWIIMRDANRYRTTDGKITTVGVWRNSLLERLGIHEQDDVEKVFGKPKEYLHVSQSVHLYTYQEGHVHVVWNQTEGRLNAVNLIK